jgi:hypothetical protein
MIHREIFHLANTEYLCAGPKIKKGTIDMAVSGQRVVMLKMLLRSDLNGLQNALLQNIYKFMKRIQCYF